jgi:hypothetical protein
MSESLTCKLCGGGNIEDGRLHATGSVTFRPQHARFLKLKTANVDVTANLCTDCGHVFLQADKDKVRALIDK